jgi:hypothetical protein
MPVRRDSRFIHAFEEPEHYASPFPYLIAFACAGVIVLGVVIVFGWRWV